MNWKRAAYRSLRAANDLNAVDKAVTTRSAKPIARRAGRRVYGKLTGRLARQIFK